MFLYNLFIQKATTMTIHENLALDRKTFQNMVQENQGLLILKFGATWCEPCKRIEPIVEKRFTELSLYNHHQVTCAMIDIDDNFDLYAFLKTRKVVKSIPAIVCYLPDNETVYPDDIVNTSDEKEVNAFFDRCEGLLKAK
jgi:thiol-disulfide isomerase/thioredoxin